MGKVISSKRFTITILLLLILSSVACRTKTPGQEKFGLDADYFIALKMLKDGNEKSAISKLNRCVKKGSWYIARRSAETLCTLGSIQDKNKAALNLYEKFPDKDSLLIAVKQLQSSGEYTKVIDLTQNLNLIDDKDELIKIRLECLKTQHSSNYEKEVYNWFSQCQISTFHYQFYRDTYEHPDFNELYAQEILAGSQDGSAIINFTPEEFAINYRIELYKRNYTYTFAKANQIIAYFSDGSLEPRGQLASDLGKTYLFGSVDFVKNANYFNRLAEQFKNSEMAFYFYFYAGRLFEKAGLYYSQSKKAFENAISSTNKADQKDNALWYLINTSLNNSLENLLKDIGSYSRQFNDPDYFDDIFDLMISSLLASGNWNAFFKLYKECDGFASDEVVAQLAYIYARLVEEGLAQGDEISKNQAFRRALNADSSYYYKIMASYKLGLSKEEFMQVLARPYKEKKETAEGKIEPDHSKDAQILLEGYAFFGFPEKIYPEWLSLYKKGLPEETYFYLAEFLQKVAEGSDNSDYYTQALRIASRGQTRSFRPLSIEELKLIFPKDYSELIEKYSSQYELNPSIMYALVRSESFFDAKVESTAGAVGLSQLMEFTASDIAKKLKLTDYSLTDAEDSIMIGSFYLAELIRRCDDNELLGFFSYNAGIRKVRRWLKSTLISFGMKSNMPLDLFLETLPYSETRGYGRKLVSATVMYEFLYGNDDYSNIVKVLMKD